MDSMTTNHSFYAIQSYRPRDNCMKLFELHTRLNIYSHFSTQQFTGSWNSLPDEVVTAKFVTQHEKIGLMCTKYTPSDYSIYLRFCVSYISSVNCIKIPIVCCTSCKSINNEVCLGTKLWNLEKVVKFYVHISPIFSCWVTLMILDLLILNWTSSGD